MNILLTSVGRRSYLVKYFKEAIGDTGQVHVSNSSAVTPAFSVADKSVVTPLIYDQEYIPFLITYCKENKISILVSLFDIDLPVLSENKKLFSDNGIQVIVSKKSVIDICNDKYETYNFLVKNGFESPKTYISKNDALLAIENEELSYPLIIKPRWGMGSIGISQVNNLEELNVLYNKTLVDIKESYLKFESDGKIKESIVIQEKLPGQEYGLDVINNLKAEYQNTVIKLKYAMRSGETDCAETINQPHLKEIGRLLSKKLGHIGNLDVDVFIVKDKPYILEMNARFGGGYPFSHAAGVNLPKAIVNWAQNKEVIPGMVQEKIGVLSHKDIGMVQLDTKDLDIKKENNKHQSHILIEPLSSEAEVKTILQEFNDIFSPTILEKVSNLDEYAKKIFKNATVYLASSNEKLGFATLYANDSINKVAYISFIGVHPDFRKNKIGKKLIDKCHQEAKEKNMKYLKLEVQKDNFTAHEFYKKNGFICLEEATNNSFYMMKKI